MATPFFIRELGMYLRNNGIEETYIKPIPFEKQNYIVVISKGEPREETTVNVIPINFFITAKDEETAENIANQIEQLVGGRKYNYFLPDDITKTIKVVLSIDYKKKAKKIDEKLNEYVVYHYYVEFKIKK